MVPDKFNMVDMEGIDLLFSYGDIIPGLYQKLVESIAQCRYQCLYNWYFDGVLIPPTYVEMTVNQDTDDVWINGGVFVTSYDCMSFYLPSLETVSGSVVNITDALSRRVKELICYINLVQSGSGDPSPNNIRQISGFLGVNVYNEETYDANATPKLTVNWQSEAGTIYGGTVTLNEDRSADVVIDKAYALVNNPDLWEELPSTSTTPFQYQYSFNDRKLYNDSYTGLICSYYIVDSSDPTNTVRWSGSSNLKFGIKSPTLTLDQIKADASAGKIAICYDLATPQTYHFDNIGELNTRLGTNTIWHDGNGDISVTYWKE